MKMASKIQRETKATNSYFEDAYILIKYKIF